MYNYSAGITRGMMTCLSSPQTPLLSIFVTILPVFLLLQEAAADLTDLQEQREWEAVSLTAEREEKIYDCCPEPYHSVTFMLTARRNEHRNAELAVPIVCE